MYATICTLRRVIPQTAFDGVAVGMMACLRGLSIGIWVIRLLIGIGTSGRASAMFHKGSEIDDMESC